MAIMKSGSLLILLFDTEMLFKFLSNFKVFGKQVSRLSSILSSSNLQIARKCVEKSIANVVGEEGGGEADASLKVKLFINYP